VYTGSPVNRAKAGRAEKEMPLSLPLPYPGLFA